MTLIAYAQVVRVSLVPRFLIDLKDIILDQLIPSLRRVARLSVVRRDEG